MTEKKVGRIDIHLSLGGILEGVEDLVKQAAKLAEATGDEEAKARVAEIKRRLGRKEKKEEEKTSRSQEGLGGLFTSLGKLIDIATTLKEETGEFDLGEGQKGRYSFGVRIGPVKAKAEEEFKAEPTGYRVRKTPKGPIVEDVREPEVEVIKEDDHILVIADVPGVNEDDINLEVKEQRLVLSTKGARKYKKEIELPAKVDAEKMSSLYKNGVFEVKLPKA